MLTKIALSAALVIVGAAPAALAASKQHVRHGQTPAQERVVAPGYGNHAGYYDYGYSYPRRGEETYIGIQDQFFRDSNGG